MDAYQDVMGLTRLKDFHGEPFVLPATTPPGPLDRPKYPVIAQRERKRQRKLQARQARFPAPPLPPRKPCWASSAASPVGPTVPCR